MHRVTVKTSTIFISKGNRTQVFHSVREVPPKLLRQLEESTNSFNSATILIADRRGKEEIVKALNGLPSNLRSRLSTSLTGAPPPAAVSKLSRAWNFLGQNWLEICLPAAVGIIVWAAFNYR